MDDSLLVRRFEGLGDLLRDRQRLVEGMGPRVNPLCEILALDEFHDERRDAVGLLEPVDRGDVRVIQRGEDLRFALKPRQSFRVAARRPQAGP